MPRDDIPADTDSGLAPLVAGFYAEAPPAVRSGLLRAMLEPVGPLAMVALAAGAFARLLPQRPSLPVEITPDIVRTINSEQVFELARYVEQKAPEAFFQLPDLVGNPQAWMATVSGALLLISLQRLRSGRGASPADVWALRPSDLHVGSDAGRGAADRR